MAVLEYVVQKRYTAVRDGVRIGPWLGGETLELDVEVAAWILRDSPGVLAVKPKPVDQPKPAVVDADGSAEVGASDRVHRGGRKRASR